MVNNSTPQYFATQSKQEKEHSGLPPPIFFHVYKSPVLFTDDILIGKGSVASLLNITKANFCVVLLINKQK